MTYKKRSSRMIVKMRSRVTGFKSIDPKLDLGNGLSAKTFAEKLDELLEMQASYNTVLADADVLKNRLNAAEKAISEYSERVLLAVAAKYGKGFA